MTFKPFKTGTRVFVDSADYARKFGEWMDAEQARLGKRFDYHKAVGRWMRECGCKLHEIVEYRLIHSPIESSGHRRGKPSRLPLKSIRGSIKRRPFRPRGR